MDKIIFKFLDMEFDKTEETKGIYFDIILGFSGEPYGHIGIQKMRDDGVTVYVFYRLRNKIMALFSIEESDALEVIGRYVGNRYNLKVNRIIKERF